MFVNILTKLGKHLIRAIQARHQTFADATRPLATYHYWFSYNKPIKKDIWKCNGNDYNLVCPPWFIYKFY